jgi:hypothetical protein
VRGVAGVETHGVRGRNPWHPARVDAQTNVLDPGDPVQGIELESDLALRAEMVADVATTTADLRKVVQFQQYINDMADQIIADIKGVVYVMSDGVPGDPLMTWTEYDSDAFTA